MVRHISDQLQKKNRFLKYLFTGNPLDCTCDMIWLRAWYQETDSLTHYPGPRCRDGTMLRESRLSRIECQGDSRTNQIPLTNEHGDVFQRRMDYNDCENEPFEEFPSNAPPLPGESEYFYDQYIDYPLNETNLVSSNYSIPVIATDRPFINISNTILNYNKHKQQQLMQQQQQPGSQFTFFGMPLPSLNMGNLWNIGRNANTRAAAGTNGKARVQVYRPDELFKFFNRNSSPPTQPQRHNHQRFPSTTAVANDRNENTRHFYRPYFQTSFLEPSQVENGGFRPMLPGAGGFHPIHNPYANSSDSPDTPDQTHINQATNIKEQANPWSETFHEIVPLFSTESTANKDQSTDEFSRPILESSTMSPGRDVESVKHGIDHTVPVGRTTMSPLQNFLSDMNTGSRYEESELTTAVVAKDELHASVVAAPTTTANILTTFKTTENQPEITTATTSTTTTTSSSITAAPSTQNTNNQPYVKHSDPWENLNHSPSSLSALVAPGAQLGIYRSPPGRSTITKVFSSTATPKAEEYHRTTSISQSNNQIEAHKATVSPPAIASTTTSTSTNRPYTMANDDTKKTNMDWYYANYNKSLDDVAPTFDPGLNRLRSTANFVDRNVTLILLLTFVISFL